jgi:hypothetical protein
LTYPRLKGFPKKNNSKKLNPEKAKPFVRRGRKAVGLSTRWPICGRMKPW